MNWVALFASEAIAIHHLQIDEEETSKSEIFKENLIAWHLFAEVLWLSDYWLGDASMPETLTFSPTSDNGLRIQYQHRF